MSPQPSAGQIPNILLFAGLTGIGRRTAAQKVLPLLYPTLPNILSGPRITLNTWAELSDLYRALREQISDSQDIESLEKDHRYFTSLASDRQVDEVILLLDYYSSRGEAVVVYSASSLFDSNARLKPEFRALFEKLREKPHLVAVFISNRLIDGRDALALPHLVQHVVDALTPEDIKVIISNLCFSLSLKEPVIRDSVLSSIGGHPSLARAWVRLFQLYGENRLTRDPRILFEVQDSILGESVSKVALTNSERDILYVLSWAPRLPAAVVDDIFADQDNGSHEIALRGLISGCLVNSSNGDLSIAAPVRQVFRRHNGYGPEKLLSSLGQVIRSALANSNSSKTVVYDMVEAVFFISALEGGSVPIELRDLIAPSTLQAIVKSEYNSGREREASYDVAIRWGLLAKTMTMPPDTREEILGDVIRSYIRKSDFASADAMLKDFNYPSKHFLNGFNNFHRRRYDAAVPDLKTAINHRRYSRSAVHLLGLSLFRLGRNPELMALLENHKSQIDRSAFLLDLWIQVLMAQERYAEVEAAFQKLWLLPEGEDRGVVRYAIFLAKRDKNYSKAISIIRDAIAKTSGRPVEMYRVLGAIAIAAGDRRLANEAIEYIQNYGRHDKEDQIRDLKIREYLRADDWRNAISLIQEVTGSGPAVQIHYASALEIKSGDSSVLLEERQRAREESLKIRQRLRMHSDLDYLGDL